MSIHKVVAISCPKKLGRQLAGQLTLIVLASEAPAVGILALEAQTRAAVVGTPWQQAAFCLLFLLVTWAGPVRKMRDLVVRFVEHDCRASIVADFSVSHPAYDEYDPSRFVDYLRDGRLLAISAAARVRIAALVLLLLMSLPWLFYALANLGQPIIASSAALVALGGLLSATGLWSLGGRVASQECAYPSPR
jgi:hypothetical protein